MRWIIRTALYAVFLAIVQLLIELAVDRAVTRYHHLFWGHRR